MQSLNTIVIHIYHKIGRRRPVANCYSVQNLKGDRIVGFNSKILNQLFCSIYLSSNGSSGITCLLDIIFVTAEIGNVQGAIYFYYSLKEKACWDKKGCGTAVFFPVLYMKEFYM